MRGRAAAPWSTQRVLGGYFGAETEDTTTGFAMTATQVAPQMAKVGGTQAADTGDCVY